jgi:dTDP-glucose 4,6-dehydratase
MNKMRKNKTILITGGAGFIGSNLVRKFVSGGSKVICVDNFITGLKSNLNAVKGKKNFRFIRHDVSKPLRIKGKVDYILHFASPASPSDYLNYPIQTLKVGALGTHNMLGLAMAKGAVFLLASTSEIYGDPLVSPQKETYWGNVNPVGPRGVYDEAKRFAESLAMAYCRVHGVNVKIARIFNTYGPGMRKDDGRAIPNFISQSLAGKPLTVYGSGKQTRSFCYIDDMIEGIQRLLLSDFNGPVNLGNPSEMPVIELAGLVRRLSRSKSKIVFKSLPVNDPKIRRPAIAKARNLLGWNPETGIRDGLAETIKWFKDRIQKR